MTETLMSLEEFCAQRGIDWRNAPEMDPPDEPSPPDPPPRRPLQEEDPVKKLLRYRRDGGVIITSQYLKALARTRTDRMLKILWLKDSRPRVRRIAAKELRRRSREGITL